ncbi:MAG: aminodeoxychorismate synthase component I [Propionivibrio sp.]
MTPEVNASEPFAFFDSDDGGGLLLTGYCRSVSLDAGACYVDKLAGVFSAIEGAADKGQWIALACDYELGACFEARAPRLESTRSLLRGWIFDRAQRLDHGEAEAFLAGYLSTLAEHQRVAGVAEVSPALNPRDYAGKVDRVKRWIADGDCYQINLTFPMSFRYFGHPVALYAALRRRQPVRYGACIVAPGETVLSFSPELFFERTSGRVVTRPMKGTAPRGSSPEEDLRNRQALLTSAKERAENIMIVDLLRNDLGRLARAGTVRVDSLCVAEAYPTLWQVVSTVSAELPDARLGDIFRALFPCGSITGAPKIRAMQCIAELEAVPRGLYTGAVGWLAPGGDCRFNVAIRTLEIDGKGHGRLGVGSGIVIDAQPEREYAECLLKARFLTGLDPGFELIETLRLEQGGYPLLDLHLQRLGASAKSLGFRYPAEIRDALQALAGQKVKGVHRVRLTLSHAGVWSISVAELAGDSSVKSAIISDDVLDPDDYLLRHKTTARSRYDQALRLLANRGDVFDAIFLNSRGEVCEGSRSNVFVERDGVLITPPLACGLLPGVLRRFLLDSGRAVEQVLVLEDLLGNDRVYLGNALRGLVPVHVLRER